MEGYFREEGTADERDGERTGARVNDDEGIEEGDGFKGANGSGV